MNSTSTRFFSFGFSIWEMGDTEIIIEVFFYVPKRLTFISELSPDGAARIFSKLLGHRVKRDEIVYLGV